MEAEILQGERVFVSKLKLLIDRIVYDFAKPESQEDALFDPAIDLPVLALLLGCPNPASIELSQKGLENQTGLPVQVFSVAGKMHKDEFF